MNKILLVINFIISTLFCPVLFLLKNFISDDYVRSASMGLWTGVCLMAFINWILGMGLYREWHFVKDGDLPKHDYGQFLVYVSFLHKKGESGWVDKNGDPVPTHYCKVTWFREKYGFDKDKGEDIIAWKEVIPPNKLKKEKK